VFIIKNRLILLLVRKRREKGDFNKKSKFLNVRPSNLRQVHGQCTNTVVRVWRSGHQGVNARRRWGRPPPPTQDRRLHELSWRLAATTPLQEKYYTAGPTWIKGPKQHACLNLRHQPSGHNFEPTAALRWYRGQSGALTDNQCALVVVSGIKVYMKCKRKDQAL
jgi:hypothetical protein